MRDPGARGVGIRVAFRSARLRARGKVLIKAITRYSLTDMDRDGELDFRLGI
jgi:hypothetical protein